MTLGTILIILVIIYLLGGMSGRFGGYGYGMGHSGMGIGGRRAGGPDRAAAAWQTVNHLTY
ncbi:hypothetical protein ABIF99_003092 [Bradyrhizobium japonicum]|nr:hypothetical protein [Bradyrhizobium japonicum]MCP1862860.1 hypothetical protein [Bradyrhizobium japonicum]MCP1893714.1 hypothetical protein [Bradyrhizobium japonicum]MCW2326829.1 hypothetical protein [Bradyrhizobium japonicum]